MFSDTDLVPISALQHQMYCPRQLGLIHVEHIWSDNALTADGVVRHARVHDTHHETRAGVRTEFGVFIRSLEYGLVGQADVVEFEAGVPFPVEHKRGKPKKDEVDAVQLCAQGMCLEEMCGVPVPAGALFYGKTRRRVDVVFDERLRLLVIETAEAVRRILCDEMTPTVVYERKKCDRCSLNEACLPKVCGPRTSAAAKLARLLEEDPDEGREQRLDEDDEL